MTLSYPRRGSDSGIRICSGCNPAVHITSETVADGIREQLFTIGGIPGVLWAPAEGSGPRPLVLLGHGGGQHKKGWEVVSRAFPYVSSCGFAVAAIDAPSTGDTPEHPPVTSAARRVN